MNDSLIYLDHNATAPAPPAVIEAVAEAMRQGGNPSSVHAAGRKAAALLNRARDQVAALAAVAPRAVVFTSGATEANNTIIRRPGFERLIISAIEHESVRSAAASFAGEVVTIGVSADGIVDLAALEAALEKSDELTLVSIMTANNETGVVQPVAEIGRLTRAHGARFHTDAVQAAGKIDLGMLSGFADFLSLSAHKIGGPAGVGAMIVHEDAAAGALIVGGGQEFGARAGTENLAGIAGFGCAAEWARKELPKMARLAALRDRLETDIAAHAPNVRIAGQGAPRLANTSNLTMPGVAAETQVMAFDLAGVAVSAGSACSSGKVTRSHVLDAMGYAPEEAGTAIRVSMGWNTKDSDIDRFIEMWTSQYARSGGRRAVAQAG